ncbi:PREDICTED: probable G-protein coupled receptor No18 [Branchiostoma belcheri]|uniref:Probable G-protein coupled receptor No18 n=1 Tax=Branchiostoma belcheri TaxID=7741 RepID=A0A6P4YDZ5_BRABE|nr:PREDICTED: probable G-protein coupled receptor No18 [Branchiostoma belcheri]
MENVTVPETYPMPVTVVVSMVVVVIIAFIVAGNVLVFVACFTSASLKTIQNRFLLSLAASDLLVAGTIMPFTLVKELLGYWSFGQIWCEGWLALDVLACTASICNLCMISFDRYWSVVDIQYARTRSAKRVGGMIAAVWVIASAVSVPPLIGWRDPKEHLGPYPVCNLRKLPEYVLFSVSASFYIPLVVLIVVYSRILYLTRKQFRKSLFLTSSPRATCASKTTPSQITRTLDDPLSPSPIVSHRIAARVLNDTGKNNRTFPNIKVQLPSSVAKNNVSVEVATQDTRDRNGEHKSVVQTSRATLSPPPQFEVKTETSGPCVFTGDLAKTITPLPTPDTSPRSAGSNRSICQAIQQKTCNRKERRVTRIIGMVMTAFVVCWFPFFVCYPVMVLCKDCHFPEWAFDIVFWLGYCNSGLNPVIYTVFNEDFRKAFKKILCRWRTTRR